MENTIFKNKKSSTANPLTFKTPPGDKIYGLDPEFFLQWGNDNKN